MFWYIVGFAFVGVSVAFQNPISFWLSISEPFAIACQSEFTVPGILLVTFTPFLTTPAGNPCYIYTWLVKCYKRILHLEWIKHQLWGGQIGFSLYLGSHLLVMNGSWDAGQSWLISPILAHSERVRIRSMDHEPRKCHFYSKIALNHWLLYSSRFRLKIGRETMKDLYMREGKTE